jgi:hypothetical protein
MWWNRMLPDFCTVAIGSWPLMIEHCGDTRQRRPRHNLGCRTIGWIDGYWESKPGIQTLASQLTDLAVPPHVCNSYIHTYIMNEKYVMKAMFSNVY